MSSYSVPPYEGPRMQKRYSASPALGSTGAARRWAGREFRNVRKWRKAVWLEWFPTAAITDDHRCRGLKHHTCIITHFQRPGTQNQSQWARIKLRGLLPSEGSQGEFTSSPFPASGGLLHSLACGLFLHVPKQHHRAFSCLISASILTLLSLTLVLLPPTAKDICDQVELN